MMNGCSSKVILASCLLEIVIIILPAILICYTICKRGEMDYFDAMAIMKTVMVFVSLVLVVSAAFVVQIFHGLDLEHLIKQKE